MLSHARSLCIKFIYWRKYWIARHWLLFALPGPSLFIPSLSIFLCLPDGICIMRHVAAKWQQLRVAISVTTLALCCAILYTRCYARLHIYNALKKILEDVDRAELQLELGT